MFCMVGKMIKAEPGGDHSASEATSKRCGTMPGMLAEPTEMLFFLPHTFFVCFCRVMLTL